MEILLLDVNTTVRTEIAELLAKLGHRVEQFSDGGKALAVFLETNFQMVLARSELPGVSGLEILQAISVLPSRDSCDVVLIGEPSKPELIVAAFKAGAYDYLLQPINRAILVEITGRIALCRSKSVKNIITVIFFDRIPLMRKGFARVLSEEPGYLLVGEAASAEECLALTGATKPDIVVVDVDSGLDLAKTLKKRFPTVKLVLFSSRADSLLALVGLDEGASALLLKDADREEILYVLKKVARGGQFIDTRITRLMVKQVPEEESPVVQLLTDQENKVLQGLARGLTNKEIAAELYLSAATVRNYVSNILRKLELPNRAAATVYGIKFFKVGQRSKIDS